MMKSSALLILVLLAFAGPASPADGAGSAPAAPVEASHVSANASNAPLGASIAALEAVIARAEARMAASRTRKDELNKLWRAAEDPSRSDEDQTRFSEAYLEAIDFENQNYQDAYLEVARTTALLFDNLGFSTGAKAERLGLAWAKDHNARSTKAFEISRVLFKFDGEFVPMSLRYDPRDKAFRLTEANGSDRQDEGELHLTIALKGNDYVADLSVVRRVGSLGEVNEDHLRTFETAPLDVRSNVSAFVRPEGAKPRPTLAHPVSCELIFKGAP